MKHTLPAGPSTPEPGTARRVLWTAWLVLALALLSGCATRTPSVLPADGAERQHWSGRLSLNIASAPPQGFSTSFELQGQAQAGELRLFSPFGQTLATATWQPQGASLRQGERTLHYPDMDALTADLTGTPLPVAALFDWLRGRATPVEGWSVDLTEQTSGRLRAQRTSPLPEAMLRLVFH